MKKIECRNNCGACCIAPSITSPIPDMPKGKPAGVKCIHLTEDFRCKIFGKKERPRVCIDLMPSEEMCGKNRDEAMAYLEYLEKETKPEGN